MESELGQSLTNLSSRVFSLAVVLLLVVNGGAALAVLTTKSRDLVNRWTGRYVAANVAILGLGMGIPLVAQVMRLVVNAVAASPGAAVQIHK
jgi:hypothetical protein